MAWWVTFVICCAFTAGTLYGILTNRLMTAVSCWVAAVAIFIVLFLIG